MVKELSMRALYWPVASVVRGKECFEREQIEYALLAQFLFRCYSPLFFSNNFKHNFLLNPWQRLKWFD